MRNRWQSKVDALIRLARDPGATPAERDTAARKLRQLTRDHPETMDYKPLAVFTMRDLGEMKRRGISTAGSWTGCNLEDAISLMVADYQQRLARGHRRRLASTANCPDAFRANKVAREEAVKHFGRLPSWARKA